jgi:hypothetical protein
MKGRIMPIEFFMEAAIVPRIRWHNLATGECRVAPPRVGELDWVEATFAIHCPD